MKPSYQVNIRMSQEEVDRLREVSEHFGLTDPALIRMLVKQAHDKLRSQERAHTRPRRSP